MNCLEASQSTCTVRISGGLGNQLFQYAAGRALSLRTESQLELDVSFFHRKRKRDFELLHFPICALIASQPSWLSRLRSKASRDASVFCEKHFHFDPELTALRSPCTLDGYFQSERYFESHAACIRRELACPPSVDAVTCSIARSIQESGATSLHVRRGDYVSNPKAAQLYHLCTVDYYRQALEMIPGNAPVYVFSDDLDWAKQHLPPIKPLVFPTGAEKRSAIEDMWLMTLASNHIIANSTFSWWGAWLAEPTNGLKIAPRQWFIDEAVDDRDLIPASWIRL